LQQPDVDAVYLFGDAQLHYGHGLAALNSAKHLFVEKPIAPGFEQASELAQAAASRGLIAVGGHNRRFYRSLAEIRRRGGKAGWRYAEATFHKPALGAPPPFGARSWLTANGVHALDALVFVMGGLPEELTAIAAPESFSAVMRWPDGAQGVFLCNNQAGERREAYAFHGLGESYRADDSGLRIEAGARASFLELPFFGDGFEAEHAAFLDAIEQGFEPAHSLANLAPSLRLAELIEDGFSGPIEWPRRRRLALVSPTPRAQTAGSLLVVNAAGLRAVIASNPPDRPLVALEDVLGSSQPRPEIVGALLGTGPSALSREALDRLPNLRVAGLVGLSFTRHRPELLLERGVSLVNASQTYAESVAEFALGLAILARRCAFGSDRLMRRRGWGTSAPPGGWKGAARGLGRALRPAFARLGVEAALLKAWRSAPLLSGAGYAPGAPRELRGASVGLVGWGSSAEAFARRLLAAGAQVLAFSEHAGADEIEQAGVRPASLGEALAADIVSLHRGLTPATRHFLGAPELARLRAGSTLINVARGALIDPDALLARLRQGDVFACLDSYEDEPLAASHPLRRTNNVFLTSHIAGGASELHVAAAREVLGKIARHLGGEPGQAVSGPRLRTMT
jgi:phosphoglycerate dehydrogenase-like enzyme